MTNKVRQQKLDKRKWLESEKVGEDLSGKMPWCSYCGMQGYDLCDDGRHKGIHTICTATQVEREGQCLCATAYNRLTRGK